MLKKTVFFAAGSKQIAFDRPPDLCPVCLNACSPVDLNIGYAKNLELQLVFRCPRETCSSHFFANYAMVPQSGYFDLVSVAPKTHRATVMSAAITELSPVFIKTSNQAEIAENQSLDEIAGVGYRRALEFLIKDYLISRAATEEEKITIRTKALGRCIGEMVQNENIKLVAKRAVWLGNDETHYVRKWENKDIKDLKVLIAMTVAWIEIELFTQQLATDMPELVAVNHQ